MASLYKMNWNGLKRWPGDGLETKRQRYVDAHCVTPNPCKHQRELTELLGGWPVDERLADMSADRKYIFHSIPFNVQLEAAADLMDNVAACEHLFTVCYSEAPKALLSRVGAYGAVKKGRRSFMSWEVDEKFAPHEQDCSFLTSNQVRHHHGINMIIARLVRNNEATDENLRMLFGSEMIVLRPLMEIKNLLSLKARPGSIAAAKQATLFDEAKLTPAVTCANCLTAPASGVSFLKCGACHREVFCSPACQKAYWKIHRVECFRACDKEVTPAHLAARDQLLKQRQEESDAKKQLETESLRRDLMMRVERFMNETGFSEETFEDPTHAVRKKDLDVDYEVYLRNFGAMRSVVALDFVDEVIMTTSPVGLFCDWRSTAIFKNPATGALVVVNFSKLFTSDRKPVFKGIAIDEVAVVKSTEPVSQKKRDVLQRLGKDCDGEVEWKLIPRPSREGIQNAYDLVQAWLKSAREQAVVCTKDVFYHVGSERAMSKKDGYMFP